MDYLHFRDNSEAQSWQNKWQSWYWPQTDLTSKFMFFLCGEQKMCNLFGVKKEWNYLEHGTTEM